MNEPNVKISGSSEAGSADAVPALAAMEAVLRGGLRPVVPDGLCERIAADAEWGAANRYDQREYVTTVSAVSDDYDPGRQRSWSSMLAVCAMSFCVGMFCMYRMLMPLIDRPATVVVSQPARTVYPYGAMKSANRSEPLRYRASAEYPVGVSATLRAGAWSVDDMGIGW